MDTKHPEDSKKKAKCSEEAMKRKMRILSKARKSAEEVFDKKSEIAKSRKYVEDEAKDEAYEKKRQKNTESCRKSRLGKRKKEAENEAHMSMLKEDLKKLKTENDVLKKEREIYADQLERQRRVNGRLREKNETNEELAKLFEDHYIQEMEKTAVLERKLKTQGERLIELEKYEAECVSTDQELSHLSQ